MLRHPQASDFRRAMSRMQETTVLVSSHAQRDAWTPDADAQRSSVLLPINKRSGGFRSRVTATISLPWSVLVSDPEGER